MKKNKLDKDYKLKKTKTIRLSDSTINDIKHITKKEKISESELLRSIIEKTIQEYKLKKVLTAINRKEISVSQGAEISGLTYREFYNKMEEYGIKFDYKTDDIKENAKKILKMFKEKQKN